MDSSQEKNASKYMNSSQLYATLLSKPKAVSVVDFSRAVNGGTLFRGIQAITVNKEVINLPRKYESSMPSSADHVILHYITSVAM
jgi:hypothetical protein